MSAKVTYGKVEVSVVEVSDDGHCIEQTDLDDSEINLTTGKEYFAHFRTVRTDTEPPLVDHIDIAGFIVEKIIIQNLDSDHSLTCDYEQDGMGASNVVINANSITTLEDLDTNTTDIDLVATTTGTEVECEVWIWGNYA